MPPSHQNQFSPHRNTARKERKGFGIMKKSVPGALQRVVYRNSVSGGRSPLGEMIAGMKGLHDEEVVLRCSSGFSVVIEAGAFHERFPASADAFEIAV